jgi:outer membrane protein, heavy metal efflux system
VSTTKRCAQALALLALLLSISNSAEAANRALSLDEALAAARKNNPVLRAAQLRIDEAKGDLRTASVLLVDNPEISVGAGPRLSREEGRDRSWDVEIGLAQRFEIAGQRGHRVERYRAAIRASEARNRDAQRVVELAVTLTFYDALASLEAVKLEEQGGALAIALLRTARTRLESGETSPVELNTAQIRRAEAARRLANARAESKGALSRLAALMGLDRSDALSVRGELPDERLVQPEDAIVARSLATRPDLVAARHDLAAAQADVELADAAAWPDVTVGLSFSHEGREDVVLGKLAVPIPLFNTNQGERQRARAALLRAKAEERGRRLTIQAQVREDFAAYDQAKSALRLYDTEVLRAQENSFALLQRAWAAGQVGYAELIVMQREVLDGRRGYLEARRAYAQARAALLSSAGMPISSNATGGSR